MLRTRIDRVAGSLAMTLFVASAVMSACSPPERTVMPDVVGMDAREANVALAEAGIDSPYGDQTYEALKVVSSEPAAGERLEPHQKVDLEFTRVTVTKVIDGDTVRLSTGDVVRLIGLDTPEVGRCGSVKATSFLREMVTHTEVLVERSDQIPDRDKHGRLLAYLATETVNDVGYQLIIEGLAVPRYDSSDGYGGHPAEAIYAEGAANAKLETCEQKPKQSRVEVLFPPLDKYPGNETPGTFPRSWICSYTPTYDRDWHNDVLCTDGSEFDRPYLRGWDSFVTEAEIMESARDYERQLNNG